MLGVISADPPTQDWMKVWYHTWIQTPAGGPGVRKFAALTIFTVKPDLACKAAMRGNKH